MSTAVTVEVKSKTLDEAIARSKVTGLEFCVRCYTELNFPMSTHVDHPVRNTGGLCYIDGGGQSCGACNPYKTQVAA